MCTYRFPSAACQVGPPAVLSPPMTWKPWTFFAVAIAGWMNRQQQEVISYLTEENRILREKLGHKRVILNDNQKRRLAAAVGNVGGHEAF